MPPVSLIPVVNLELRISPRIFEKFETAPMVYSGAWGKLIHEKNQKQKSRDTVPLKRDSVTRFSLVFFMNQFPPIPRVYHEGRFEFFQKFTEIFAAKGLPPVSTTPVANAKNLQS